ncbi:hypothetical protein HDE_03505 [Halotydeus destructor]|nr:hypothetical protein HDE_03505 [Halotydeus destructor]
MSFIVWGISNLRNEYRYFQIMLIAKCITMLLLLVCVATKTSDTARLFEELSSNSKVTTGLTSRDKASVLVPLVKSLATAAILHHCISNSTPEKLELLTFGVTPYLPGVLVYASGFAIATGSIYVLYAYLYSGVLMYTNDCHAKLEAGPLTIADLRNIYLNVQKVRRSANQCLGLVPFILCVQLFVLMTMLIANAKKLEMDVGLKNMQLIMRWEVFDMLLTFVALNMAVERGNSRAIELRTRVLGKLSEIKCGHLEQDLLRQNVMIELTEDTAVPAMAWNAFPLGKDFVFRFFGSLIPFLAMAIPLMVAAFDGTDRKISSLGANPTKPSTDN